MYDTKKIRRTLKLYPIYEAMSGDLMFYSVIEVLFLTLVKGFSVAEIAAINLIYKVIALLLEYPAYRLIRRLGNSLSSVIGGFLPLASIILITLGQGMPVVILGKVCDDMSENFQSMACASARNNLSILGEKERYPRLFARGTMLLSALTMISAVVSPLLFSINRMLPSYICIFAYALTLLISFFMRDYSDEGSFRLPPAGRRSSMKMGRSMKYLLVVFCAFLCMGAVFATNTELLLNNNLRLLLSEDHAILLYGGILWASRFIRLGTNLLLPKILDSLKNRIIFSGAAAMIAAFLVIGAAGLLLQGTVIGIVLIGICYVVVRGVIWDPMRAFLRILAVDTNSKRRQQRMLVLLNIGQSVFGIAMDLVVVCVLEILSLEYVFLVFALIAAAEAVFALKLGRELKKNIEILNMTASLTESEIDDVALNVSEILQQTGMDSKQALSYRLLIEERLLDLISEGRRGEKLMVILQRKQDEIAVELSVGDTPIDVFAVPHSGDSSSLRVYSHLLRSADML